jgi:hypothetical protein
MIMLISANLGHDLQYVFIWCRNLGRNRFNGTANLPDILNLQNPNVSLVTLDLSHNNLQGPLPSWDASNLGPIQEL